MTAGQLLNRYVRRIELPPAAPWDQWRAARMQAFHGGPLSSEAAAISVRRLGRWAPGAPGIFAAAYVRRSEQSPSDFETIVDGLPVRFRFPKARTVADFRSVGVTALYVVAACLGVGLAVEKAFEARARNADLLAKTEVKARHWGQARRRIEEAAQNERLLRQAGAERRSFADVSADLVWLGRARSDAAVIERVRWAGPEMFVLADGSDPPFVSIDRQLTPAGDIAGAREWVVNRRPQAVIKTELVRPAAPNGARPTLTRPHVVP